MTYQRANLTSALVTKRTDWNDSLFSITLHSPSTQFQAGQFTKLGLFDENGKIIKRAYSIITHPEQHQATGELEFLIISDPRGQLSPLLHSLQVGEQVLVGTEGTGTMTLEEIPVDCRDLWMISSGTGIGPFICLLNDKKIGLRFNHLVLVHAVRHRKDLTYTNIIQSLEKQYPGKLIYIPVISRETHPNALSGRVPQLLNSGELERTAGISLDREKSFVYLCGNPQMVKDTSNSLKNIGLEKHLRRKPGQFASENYW